MAVGGLVLGSPILYLKGIRILMFQLSGFYYKLRILGAKTLTLRPQPLTCLKNPKPQTPELQFKNAQT